MEDTLKGGSRGVAKERLRTLLTRERTAASPGLLEAVRDEVASSVRKHIEVDPNRVTVEIKKWEGSTFLVATIPLVRLRREIS